MSDRLSWFLVALLVPALASCASPHRSKSGSIGAKLPHAVAVNDGMGGNVHLHLKPMVADGGLTSGFGWRSHAMGGGGARHRGLDIIAPAGSPVRAGASGTITDMGWRGAYGRFILIRHSRDIETAYAHLSRFAKNLRVGQRVTLDDVIGYVGSSGRSSGPHLHFELRRQGRPIDPLRLPHARIQQL